MKTMIAKRYAPFSYWEKSRKMQLKIISNKKIDINNKN